MIIISILSVIIMIMFSYFSNAIPELLLITLIILSYKKHISSNKIRLYSLLTGYISDVLFYSDYPIHTLTYFIIALIINSNLRKFTILNKINFFRVTLMFIFSQKFGTRILMFTVNKTVCIFSDSIKKRL